MNNNLQVIEQTLLQWCNRRVGHIATVTIETNLIDEGLLDSLMVMDLATTIEKDFGVVIDHSDISPQNFRSVRTLAGLISSRNAAK